MPDTLDWAAFDAAFDRALSLDGEARDAYLDTLDDETRGRLAPLLADALRDDPLLDRPDRAFEVLVEAVASGPAETVAEGARVGAYRIDALVGEGGMGRVYRAHRADGAFEQTVALKVVRQSLALAGSDVAARLHRERNVLASLDHEGIARLIDGGETPDGVPYLVTEFIDGTAITDYADAHRLDVAARVRLMAAVARAVEHAHRRFVVHRDLKPSNVLVAERDGAARPVVLDFGIATLLDAADEAQGTFAATRTGMRMLTPAYAAPELYDPSATVTTAADVYGLGAMLYELLTARRPHDHLPRTGLSAPGPPRTEPVRPSRAVAPHTATPSAAAPSAEAPPPFDPAARARALRGDLDVICLAALHPDPARRYATAADLADDLERHLDGRPVEARPDSVAYVAGRFVRRNRAVVAAAAVALAALVVGLGAALVSLTQERAARAEADASAARATEAADLLATVLTSADPETSNRGDVTVREALDRSLPRIGAVASLPLRSYLLSVAGRAYRGIGDYARSDSLLRASVRVLDGADAPPAVLAASLYALGRSYGLDGRPAVALPLLLRADSLARRDGPRGARVAFDVARNLSWLHRELGHPAEAMRWAERSVRLAREFGDPDRECQALFELGSSQSLAGDTGAAIATLRRTLALAEATYGENHARLVAITNQLSVFLIEDGQLEEAIAVSRRTVRIAQRAYGPDHVRQIESRDGLGTALLAAGHVREAESYLDAAATVARRVPYGDGEKGALLNVTLARARTRLGRYRDAEAAAREALRIAETLPVGPVPLRALALVQIGLAQAGQGHRAGATLRRALSAFAQHTGDLAREWSADRDAAEQALRTIHAHASHEA